MPDATLPRRGLILFAHGARDPAWAQPFERTRAQLEAQLPTSESSAWVVRLAYLEFMSPDLAHCGAELAALGCRRVDVLPIFLGAGGHVRKDLPAQVEALRQAHPDVDWRLQHAAGESERLVQALADWAAQVAQAKDTA